jgi:hypothetical protein
MTNAVSNITNSPASINGLDVVEKVNGFYTTAFDHAFSQILWLLGILIVLLGIIVPVVYYFLQNRQLALKEKALTEYLEKEVSKLGDSFREKNQIFLDGLEKKLKGEILHAKAGVCLVQGNSYLRAGQKKNALSSYAWVLTLFTQAPDLKQVQASLRFQAEQVFPKVNKNDFDTDISAQFNEAIKLISEIKAGGLLDVDFEKYKKEFAAAQIRNV